MNGTNTHRENVKSIKALVSFVLNICSQHHSATYTHHFRAATLNFDFASSASSNLNFSAVMKAFLIVFCGLLALAITNVESLGIGRDTEDMLLGSGWDSNTTTSECCNRVDGPERPGSCPPFQTAIACLPCIDKCLQDNDCEEPQQICCCHSGCGNFCSDPY